MNSQPGFVFCRFTLTLVVFSFATSPYANELADLHQRARAAAAKNRFDAVEKLRIERRELIRGLSTESPWTRGLDALDEADRCVDGLRYRDAAKALRAAWQPFAEGTAGDGVFGDIGVRLFEVTQQALVAFSHADEEGHADLVATKKELRDVIDICLEKDPCQVEAHVIRAFLTEPDPKERFLRAEVRPSLSDRNKRMVGLSYQADSGDSPLMTWHAPVESLKAENSKAVLLGDVNPVFGFLEPDAALRGVDANGSPFAMLFKRWVLLMEMPDKNGIPRPVNVFVDRGKWRRTHVRLLWREPSPSESVSDEVRRHKEFFERLAPIEEWQVSGQQFVVYDLPVAEASMLQRAALEQLVVKNVKDLVDKSTSGRFSPRDFAKRLMRATPAVWGSVLKSAMTGDVTKSPLVELSLLPGMNPLVVLSFDGEKGAEPAFIRDAKASNPYLKIENLGGLENGMLEDRTFVDGMLEYDAAAEEYIVSLPGLRGHVPLQMRGIPASLVGATTAGNVLARILVTAGYSESAAMEEITFDNPAYIPEKVKSLVMRRAGSTKKSLNNVWSELFQEHGWEPKGVNASPMQDLQSRYASYGFRYFSLLDARKCYVTHLSLLPGSQSPDEKNPFLYDVRDESTGDTVDEGNRYRLQDYRDLYANVATMFLPTVVAYQPSLQASRLCMEWVGVDRAGSGDARMGYRTAQVGTKNEVRIPPFNFQDWDMHDNDLRDMLDKLTIDVMKRGFAEVTTGEAGEGSGQGGRPKHVIGKVGEPDWPFRWMQLRAAREAVKKEWRYREPEHHRSLTLYNDIVDSIRATRTLDVTLFDRVPTPEELKRFGDALVELVENQVVIVIAHAEQGSVLASAGFIPSAEFAWDHLASQYHDYVKPMIEHSIDYAESYGFAKPPEVEIAKGNIEKFIDEVEEMREAVRQASGGAYENRFVPSAEDDARGQLLVERLKQLVASDGKAREARPAEKSFDATIDELMGLRFSFDTWLSSKRCFAEHAPASLLRKPPEAISSWRFAPVDSYDEVDGFVPDKDRLFGDALVKRAAKLLRDGIAMGQQESSFADDGDAFFLAGWYLVDRAQPVFAKKCFIAAAKCFRDRAGKTEDIPAIVARRNSMAMLVAAASVLDTPPGVDAVKADFLVGLPVQATIWKRLAYAKGLKASHVDAELVAVRREIQRISTELRSMEGRRASRYFFVDYRSRFGAIPDIVVADALKWRLYENVPRDERGVPVIERIEGMPAKELDFPTFVEACYPTPFGIELNARWLKDRLGQKQVAP
jgi:hypothetical protein